MVSRKGFTMVELLVVLIILAILVAVAVPMYFNNVKRSKASEAVAALGLIRQAERDYYISHDNYVAPIANGSLPNKPTDASPGLRINVGVTQYFANGAYSLVTTPLDAAPFDTQTAVDFIITANGGHALNTACPAVGLPANCAVKASEVDNSPAGSAVIVKMDNSGRTFVSYDTGANWEAY